MKAWRAGNLSRIADKWRRKNALKQLPPDAVRALPFREAFLVLEAASMEDDEDVQELWARIIFKATRSNSTTELKKMHIDLIKSLNGLEATLLMLIFRTVDDYTRDDVAAGLKEIKGLEVDQLRVALLNLQRLGIVGPDIWEREILNKDTVEEWERGVTTKTLLKEFKSVSANIVWHLNNLTGNPMNDFLVGEERYADLILSYSLTRIGYDLYDATKEDDE